MNELLKGVTILDLTRLLPGPYATRLLAQMGAEVIKIEDPNGGDYARSLAPDLFAQVNRGKASITLDLKNADDVAAFKRLVADADAVIESFRPGVMDRLGCGYETLKQINPCLVYAALTGYGQTGPLRDAAGHDVNYLALAGVLDQTGGYGAPPAMSNVQIADLAGGALTCTAGVLAAVIGARASAQGTFVDAAMLDGSLALQPVAMATRSRTGRSPPRGADTLSGALPNYRIYKCRDGRYLAVGALEPKFFARLLDALTPFGGSAVDANTSDKGGSGSARIPGHLRARFDRALSHARRSPRWNRIGHWTLAGILRLRSRDAWTALLADTDACTTPVLTLDEALAHPQIGARAMRQGDALGCPLQFDGEPRAPLADSPELGADNARILGR